MISYSNTILVLPNEEIKNEYDIGRGEDSP